VLDQYVTDDFPTVKAPLKAAGYANRRISVSLARSCVGRGPHFKVEGDQSISRRKESMAPRYSTPAWRTGARRRNSYGSSDSGGRGTTLLRLLGDSTTHHTHLGRLDFGDDRYTWKRLLNQIDDDIFNHGDSRLLHCLHLLSRLLCPTFELSPGQTFAWHCLG
jgi:hypothetical protein